MFIDYYNKKIILILLSFAYISLIYANERIILKTSWTDRGYLNVKEMMDIAGYDNRQDFINIMVKNYGENWDLNINTDATFEIDAGPLYRANDNESGGFLDGLFDFIPDKEPQNKDTIQNQYIKNDFPNEYIPTNESTYKKILSRGYLICGSYGSLNGFSEKISNNEWRGFDIDICKSVAQVIFSDNTKIKFIEVDDKNRFEKLYTGEIDILSSTTTYNLSRDIFWNIEFMPTTFYDGQGFMVRKSLGVRSAKELNNIKVCIQRNTTAYKNIIDFYDLWNLKFTPIVVNNRDEAIDKYLNNLCEMYGTDKSALSSLISNFDEPENHMILPEIISKEPLSPAIKYGDKKFSNIVKWTIYLLIYADEINITSKNIDDKFENDDFELNSLNGVGDNDYKNVLRMISNDDEWIYKLIKYNGNYSEIFDKNLGSSTKLKLEKGINKPYSRGGILYSPPFK